MKNIGSMKRVKIKIPAKTAAKKWEKMGKRRAEMWD